MLSYIFPPLHSYTDKKYNHNLFLKWGQQTKCLFFHDYPETYVSFLSWIEYTNPIVSTKHHPKINYYNNYFYFVIRIREI